MCVCEREREREREKEREQERERERRGWYIRPRQLRAIEWRINTRQEVDAIRMT